LVRTPLMTMKAELIELLGTPARNRTARTVEGNCVGEMRNPT